MYGGRKLKNVVRHRKWDLLQLGHSIRAAFFWALLKTIAVTGDLLAKTRRETASLWRNYFLGSEGVIHVALAKIPSTNIAI
jgi:hypothetical protein